MKSSHVRAIAYGRRTRWTTYAAVMRRLSSGSPPASGSARRRPGSSAAGRRSAAPALTRFASRSPHVYPSGSDPKCPRKAGDFHRMAQLGSVGHIGVGHIGVRQIGELQERAARAVPAAAQQHADGCWMRYTDSKGTWWAGAVLMHGRVPSRQLAERIAVAEDFYLAH